MNSRGAGLVIALPVLFAPPAAASPPLPAVVAVSPGVGLAAYDTSMSDGDTCTAGFLVRDKGGAVGVLTGGHCDRGGTVAVNLSGRSYTPIGPFTGGLRSGDIGFVALSPATPANPSVNGVERVTGVSDKVTKGQVLCKVGLATQRQCGPVTDVTAAGITFAAATSCGDSGGPVFAVHPDGTVSAVGITIAETMGPGTIPPPCGVPATFAIAQPIQPWLRHFGMTVLTS